MLVALHFRPADVLQHCSCIRPALTGRRVALEWRQLPQLAHCLLQRQGASKRGGLPLPTQEAQLSWLRCTFDLRTYCHCSCIRPALTGCRVALEWRQLPQLAHCLLQRQGASKQASI